MTPMEGSWGSWRGKFDPVVLDNSYGYGSDLAARIGGALRHEGMGQGPATPAESVETAAAKLRHALVEIARAPHAEQVERIHRRFVEAAGAVRPDPEPGWRDPSSFFFVEAPRPETDLLFVRLTYVNPDFPEQMTALRPALYFSMGVPTDELSGVLAAREPDRPAVVIRSTPAGLHQPSPGGAEDVSALASARADAKVLMMDETIFRRASEAVQPKRIATQAGQLWVADVVATVFETDGVEIVTSGSSPQHQPERQPQREIVTVSDRPTYMKLEQARRRARTDLTGPLVNPEQLKQVVKAQLAGIARGDVEPGSPAYRSMLEALAEVDVNDTVAVDVLVDAAQAGVAQAQAQAQAPDDAATAPPVGVLPLVAKLAGDLDSQVPGQDPEAGEVTTEVEGPHYELGARVMGSLHPDDEVVVIARVARVGAGSFDAVSDRFDVETREPLSIQVMAHPGFAPLEPVAATVTADDAGSFGAVAFRFRPLRSTEHLIEIQAFQKQQVLGRLVLDSFGSTPLVATSVDRARGFDVYIVVSDDGEVRAISSDGTALDGAAVGSISSGRSDRELIDGRVASFWQDEDADPVLLEDELIGIGQDIALALPAPVRQHLTEAPGPLTVVIHHPSHFDFPFELAYLDGEDPQFLGERHRVSRHLRTTAARRSQVTVEAAVSIRNTTYLSDAADALQALTDSINTLTGQAVEELEQLDHVRLEVFRKARFDLIDIVTHMTSDQEKAGLVLQNGVLRAGQSLPPQQKQFGERHPMVVVNACSSSQGDAGLYRDESFAGLFLDAGAACVIGTVIPVEPVHALTFARLFYRHCTDHRAAEALRLARLDLGATPLAADPDDGAARARRRLSAAAYCMFGNQDLKVTFNPSAPPVDHERKAS